MKVCIASSNYYPSAGGIATFSYRLAALLQQSGHQVVVLTVDPDFSDKEDKTEIQENGVMVVWLSKSFLVHYNYYRKFFRPGGIDAPYWIAMGIAMKDWLAKNKEQYKFDLIDASAYGGFAAFLQDASLPSVLLSGHGAYFQYKQLNENSADDHSDVVEQLERLSFRNSNAFICHSPQSKAAVEKHTAQPVYLARIPFLFEERKDVEITTGLSQQKYALIVGGLQKLKGPEVLCEALSRDTHSSSLKFIWVGSDNYHQKKGILMSKYLSAKYPGIWGSLVVWNKYATDDELFALYKGASFIIIPSLSESFNVISIEAAFHGKPIIITETTGSSFLFTHKNDAWIIPPDNPDEMLKAIVELDKSPTRCSAIGQAAKEKITALLTPDAIISERIAIYKKTTSYLNGLRSEEVFDLLSRYTTKKRKYYYMFRQLLKKVSGRRQ